MGALIKLPTAAPRQVKQSSIRAVRAYKAANPWPGEHVPNHERERRARNALLEDMQRTPALLICMALLSNADDATRAKVAAIAELASLTRPDCAASQQALLLARSLGGKLSPEARVINAACPNGEGR